MYRLIACFLSLAPLTLSAQTSLGASSIGGQVVDSAGLAIQGAEAELLDVERGLPRKAVTNASGNYLIPALPAGLYTLSISKSGFEKFTLSNFQLVVNQRATIDAKLQVGAVTESIQVNARGETPLLETASNSLGAVVDRERVEALPLNGRNFLQLGLMAGGTAVPQGVSDVITGQQGHPGRSIQIGGNLQGVTSYLIDGISTRGSRLGESSLNLSIAAIDQFKVQISFFMPDQGPNPGIVNVITKSGTNQFHGQAFEYVRNQAFDARNFFAPSAEPLQRNQFGFALGGPVWIPRLIHGKDKIWFSSHYEGERQVQKFSQRAFTPTAAMFNGNFTEVPQPIFNPLSFDPATGQRQPFPNNLIPANLINSVSKGLLRYYRPGSSFLLRPANVFANPRNLLNDDQFGVRVDTAVSDRQTLFANFLWEDSPAINESVMPLAGSFFPENTQLAVVQHTFTIRPNLVNIARIGFSRSSVYSQGEEFPGGLSLSQIGIAGTLDDRGPTGINIQGFAAFGRASGPLGDVDNNYQVDEGLNYIRGNHSFQFGADIRYHRTKQQNANANARGSLSFQTVFTAQLTRNTAGQLTPLANTGNAFADYLLGIPTSGQVVGLPPFHYHFTQWIPYVQDSWRVTHSLTLNYGISWYYGSIPDPQGAERKVPHAFDPATGLLKYAALGQVDPKVIRPAYNNFTPRFGFAWQPSFLKNTVLRSGAGVYFSDTRIIEAQFGLLAPPFQPSLSILNSQFDPNPAFVLGKNVFPVIPTQSLSPDFAVNLPPGFAPFSLNENARTPYVIQWNFSVQHTIAKNSLMQVDYMGSSGHKQQDRYDIDQCRVTPALGCNPATRPYPRYANMLYADNTGNLTYEALVARFEHQFSHGLTALADYAFSKTITDGWEGGGSTQNQIASCRRCDRGPVSYHVPHRLVISTIYELPFGRSRFFGRSMPRVADLALGGWNLNGIISFSSGDAFTVNSPNRTGSNFSDVRAVRLCDGADRDLRDRVRDNGGMFFNTACFQPPADGFFGNSGRGILIGPGVNNWDVGVEKIFPLYERSKLLFRSEFFNAWNHTQFNNPSLNTGDTIFGRVSSARPPRLIQFGMKLTF